jgi:ferredoxin
MCTRSPRKLCEIAHGMCNDRPRGDSKDGWALHVKVVVDLSVCQGYAQCAFLAPEAFRMVGVEGLMYDPEPSDELVERVQRAAAACPVQAISIELAEGADGRSS